MLQEHDKTASRLTMILMKFNDGERFTVDDLACEFNVSKRTIQRDINDRFSFLPIEKENGYYYLASYVLGKLSLSDIKNFAIFSGIRELYPELSDQLIVDVLNQKTNKALHIKGYNYEDVTHKIDDFNQIGAAIIIYEEISFEYKEKNRVVKPYRLINTNGIWYLVAVEDEVLKTFSFSQIVNLKRLEICFEPDTNIVDTIEDENNTWFTQNPIEVTLEVDASVAKYFLRRELLPHQKTLEHVEEKLILSTKITYEEELLRVVRY